MIGQLVKKAGNRIIIMPGSGINDQNIKEIRDRTKAKEFHLTGRKLIESQMKYRKEGIFMGGLSQIPEYQLSLTDAEKIRKIVNQVNQT